VITENQTPVRVLVVDDSEVFRHVVCDVVAATPGFEVIADASSGREALALVGSMAAQLVMLDVHMPELDGIETARRIRRQYPDVVVLLLTATRREQLSDPSLTIEDKRDLSCQLLADFWRRHCPDG
jgi:CheY-like chemotaxis protein